MRVNGKDIALALANTAAVFVALSVAFAGGPGAALLAMFTVFILAKPITGAVRSFEFRYHRAVFCIDHENWNTATQRFDP